MIVGELPVGRSRRCTEVRSAEPFGCTGTGKHSSGDKLKFMS